MTLFFIVYGVLMYFDTGSEKIKNLSAGFIIGMLRFLKMAIEIFENHRKDKNILEEN